VDNLDSGEVNDMNVSYDFELNLSTNFEPSSFEELLLMMSGKNPCRRSMMLSSRMGRGSSWILHLEPNQLAAGGSCYHGICTCAKPFARCQSYVTIRSIYHCHLGKYFHHFSEGERSNAMEVSLVTSRDPIARLAKPMAPYLGHSMR
jgi:hypothetical protein